METMETKYYNLLKSVFKTLTDQSLDNGAACCEAIDKIVEFCENNDSDINC
jgi:hypothetical protein